MNKGTTEFKVDKITATHADALKAIGLADLLQSIFEEPVQLVDEGPSFLVRLPGEWRDCVGALPHSPRYPWLDPGRGGPGAPAGVDTINLSQEFERVRRWGEHRRQLRQLRGSDPELEQLVQLDCPRPRWWIVAAMTPTKLKAINTWNRVAQSIAEQTTDGFESQVRECLDALSSGQPPRVRWNATSSGLFCPSSIKGFNELKPQGTNRGSVPVNDFEEWLRYQGYWQCAHLVSDADNIRIYVPLPGQITSRSIGRVVARLEREVIFGCGPQSDILAVLALARLLIEHSKEYHEPQTEPDPELSFQVGSTPAKLLSGISVTHFAKTSPQAYGVQSTAVLSLPDWFPIENRLDAEDWLRILDEHRRVILGLRDNRSDEIGLLVAYRQFLERRGESALWELVEFMEQYGAFAIRANGLKQENRVRWITRFTDQYFGRIVMGTSNELIGIIGDPGFEAVAAAVRRATVSAQNRRARFKAGLAKEDEWREIRYELLHDIHRTRKVPGTAFVESVSEFISRYNYENARRREEKKDLKAAPANVSEEAFKSFAALVDRHGAAVVGALLAAYGTCKEKWEGEEEKPEVEEEK